MTERTYPREWFEVGRWADKPRAVTIIRETEQMLFRENGRRCKKADSYSTWYPTREEAQRAIDRRIQREQEQKHSKEYALAAVDACREAGLTLGQLKSGVIAKPLPEPPAE